jgi:hypothetical protein
MFQIRNLGDLAENSLGLTATGDWRVIRACARLEEVGQPIFSKLEPFIESSGAVGRVGLRSPLVNRAI